jgi:hypothetical protein
LFIERSKPLLVKMQVSKSALSLLFLLGCSNQFHSTTAFSSSVSKASTFGLKHSIAHPTRTSPLAVATSDDIAIADMQRGIGGRLEDAFQSAKERGEAAFVTFVTAGYPRAQGEYIHMGLLVAAANA